MPSIPRYLTGVLWFTLTCLFISFGVISIAHSEEQTDFLELRVNEYDTHRYIRIESKGRGEFARHNWYQIVEMRQGKFQPDKVHKIFQHLKALGFWELKHYYAPKSSDTPTIDPSEARLEMKIGPKHHVVIYSLHNSPQNLRRIHQYLLDIVYELPDHAPRGDYIRSYALSKEEQQTLQPGYPLRTLDDTFLKQHPKLYTSFRQPGRLFRIGKRGKSWARKLAAPDPPGFFSRYKGVIYHTSLFSFPPK